MRGSGGGGDGIYCAFFCCPTQEKTGIFSATAEVSIEAAAKRAELREKMEIEIRADFDFEAVKTSDAAERQRHAGAGSRRHTGEG